jgi:hypothetical protein
MDITAIIKAIAAPQEGRKSIEGLHLAPGDQLYGRVLQLENDGRVLIDLGGFRAMAQTSIPVKKGQVLQLEVIKTGVPLHLRVQTEEGPATPRPLPQMDLERLLPQEDRQRLTQLLDRMLTQDQGSSGRGKLPDIVRQAAMQLRTVFEGLSLEKESPEIADGLRTRMEDRGLFFEKKLADSLIPRPESNTNTPLRDAGLSRAPSQPQPPVQASNQNQPQLQPQLQTQIQTQQQQPQMQTQIPPQMQGDTQNTPIQEPLPQSQTEGQAGSRPEQTAVKDDAVPSPAGTTPEGRSLQQTSVLTSNGLKTGLQTILSTETQALADQKVLDALAKPTEQAATQEAAAEQAGIPGSPSSGEHQTLSTALMRDLKAQLLVLQTYFSEETRPEEMPAKEVEFLGKQIQKMLAHVELQQERVVQRSGDGDAFQVVAHWVTVEEQTRPVKLKVYYPRQKQSGRDGSYHRVSLLLDMDRLGMVRVDLASLEKQLQIDFYVEKEESRQQIEENKQEILETLKQSFEQINLTVRISKEKIERFDREDQDIAGVGRIDIKA